MPRDCHPWAWGDEAMPHEVAAGDDARRIQYKSGYRVFLLLGLFFIGVSIYEYYFWTNWEREVADAKERARQHPSILPEIRFSEESIYARFYDQIGKWGVVGLNAAAAILFVSVSAYLFRALRR